MVALLHNDSSECAGVEKQWVVDKSQAVIDTSLETNEEEVIRRVFEVGCRWEATRRKVPGAGSELWRSAQGRWTLNRGSVPLVLRFWTSV